jgi:soluble lytic murein transglycosylase-like protein
MDRGDQAFQAICERFGIEPDLAAGIITVESEWNPLAVRYEGNFHFLVAPDANAEKHGITPITERVLQKCSYGLMQIMGGRARELGFALPLPALFEAKLNIEYGCRCLRDIKRRYTKLEDIIAAYNAGSAKRLPTGPYLNQSYVDKVLRAMKH